MTTTTTFRPQPILGTRFTAGEIDLISHRLEVGEAIADVLGDEHASGGPVLWTREQIEDGAEFLRQRVAAGLGIVAEDVREIEDVAAAPFRGRELILALLRDCLEGSTYAAAAEAESPQRGSAAQRVGRSAARKVAAILGVPLRDLELPGELM